MIEVVRPGVFRTSTAQDEMTVLLVLGSLMGLLASLAFTAVTIFVLVEQPFMAVITGPAMVLGWAFFGVFGYELFVRLRRTGTFVIDAAARTLVNERTGATSRIAKVRPSSYMAASFGGPAKSWWAVVDVEGGGAYRVARKSWGEVRPFLGELARLGVPVDGADPEWLLRAANLSVRRLGPTTFEFDCRERLARVIAPLVLAGFFGMAGLLGSGFVLGAVRGELDPGAALFAVPLALFFAFGIAVGVRNVVIVYRRSGVFVIDVACRSLSRNGVVLASPIASLRLGSPGLVGIRRSHVFGPQLLAVRLASGRWFHLARSLPGDVRFAADVLRGAGATVDE